MWSVVAMVAHGLRTVRESRADIASVSISSLVVSVMKVIVRSGDRSVFCLFRKRNTR